MLPIAIEADWVCATSAGWAGSNNALMKNSKSASGNGLRSESPPAWPPPVGSLLYANKGAGVAEALVCVSSEERICLELPFFDIFSPLVFLDKFTYFTKEQYLSESCHWRPKEAP